MAFFLHGGISKKYLCGVCRYDKWIFKPKIYPIFHCGQIKFMFSKKATKIDEIFTVNLTLCSKCQINGEDYVNLIDVWKVPSLYWANLCLFEPPFWGLPQLISKPTILTLALSLHPPSSPAAFWAAVQILPVAIKSPLWFWWLGLRAGGGNSTSGQFGHRRIRLTLSSITILQIQLVE